jgi:hypothetical protein
MGNSLQPGQVVRGWLVRNQDQAGVRPSLAQGRECPENDRLVCRPGRPRDEARRASSKTEQWLVGWDDPHPVSHTVESGIAQNSNPIGADP